MCILCGGQCGGAGDLLISMGLPFLALYVLRMKGFLIRMKNKVLRRSSAAENMAARPNTCECCGAPSPECRQKLSPMSPELKLAQLSELSIATGPEHELHKPFQKGPVGIKGWLFLLCFNLIILVPAFSLYQTDCIINLLFLPQYRILLSIWSKNYYYLNVATIFIMAFIAVFSFYSGWRLWSIKEGAVKTAKIFLIVQLSLTLFMLISQQIILSLSLDNRDVPPHILGQFIAAILYFSVWYVYLLKSRRVHNTYVQSETLAQYATVPNLAQMS